MTEGAVIEEQSVQTTEIKPASMSMSDSANPTAVLVDGYGLIFRAYHALPPSMATAAGEQTNAVYGFASMLLDVLKARQPTYAVIALEGGKTFRHDAFADYKANRGEMPDDLREQVKRVHELIGALGLPIEQRDGYEADDVIGSLSRELPAAGVNVIVVTGDSDLLQLVSDDVMVVLPGARRFGEVREFDTPAVFERYGFGPELVPDYKALVGDTSDNIPGVPGIGDKTAKALIAEYGPLEAILDHLDDVTPTRARNALREHAEQAMKSKELATIVRDLAIDVDLDRCRVGHYDRDAVTDLFRELEFRSLLAKLPEPAAVVNGGTRAVIRQADQTECARTLVNDEAQLQRLADRIRTAGEIAFDVETDSTDPQRAGLVGIAVATSPTESFYVPVGHNEGSQLPLDAVRSALDEAFGTDGLKFYAHHGKYDLHVLTRHGFAKRPLAFDTMIAAYLLGETSLRLKELAFTKLGIQMTEITELIGTGRNQATMDAVPVERAAPYACGDVEATFALVAPLQEALVERQQMNLLEEIELPLVPVLLAMEQAGVAIDTDMLAAFSKEITERIEQVTVEIYEHAGEPINIGSNRQLATLLFEKLRLTSGRRTKTGYSVDSDVLERLREEHPVVGLILEYRTLAKLKSTYVDSLPAQVNPKTGRVHTSFNQTIAATGRLSSINPNLQNIPIRTDLGRRVRAAFVADHRPQFRYFDDAVLLGADYSQMELRILA
ncbi:MAG: DNA polymerase I, partial [Chloroflexota bacterium]|nr:DNA polymerase I [Chloroflexota bacterium]